MIGLYPGCDGGDLRNIRHLVQFFGMLRSGGRVLVDFDFIARFLGRNLFQDFIFDSCRFGFGIGDNLEFFRLC